MQTNETKVALVTGANTGVGFQIAKALAENGYDVYVGSRNLQKGEDAAKQIGGKTQAIQLDITDPESIRHAVSEIAHDFGYLTLLVNNAAISNAGTPGRTLWEILSAQKASVASIEEMRQVWETNVFGTLALTQAFLPLLRKAKAARIVTVSSSLGSLTLNADADNAFRSGFDAVYGASKTALNGVFLSLANELENTNVKVNLVSPGFTATALNNFEGTDSVEEGSLEPIRVALAEDIPNGSFTGPATYRTAQGSQIPW
ncbi:MAG: SDR family NAD(P)-dependent oxidoreductase [Sphingobacterium sp.]|jgi:NAD(P)-dependent dehydrogenase (short-subunit alcohol dehydrogenase family)|uniref:SDR family NAD(P)-dependent oxidoreductase n=1 Tax=Sphingobacterium sp. TaxID=341027 RepID=UPI00281F19D9|nr:SDR family NAD(P)-dependent oxidoreductase [Sphingobacterium sp.]MDR0262435.1 SDR family NAD(P)-dependent oxidoreductase [Sphingobacterium sp.]